MKTAKTTTAKTAKASTTTGTAKKSTTAKAATKKTAVTAKTKTAQAPTKEAAAPVASMTNRDYSKYNFNGEVVGKRKLVHHLIKDYVEKHPEVTSDELRAIFGKGIIKPLGKTRPNGDNLLKRLGVTSLKTFFTGKDELVKAGGDAQYFAIFNQWPKNAFDKFLEKAKGLGYSVRQTKNDNELIVA